jgi:type I restriction enzyme S subunit
MASDWKEITLGSLLQFSNGKASPNRINFSKIPVFGSNGIIGYCDEPNSDENLLIIGRVGSYCGSVYYSSEKCWITDNAIKAISIDGNSSRFLFYLLKRLNLNNWREGSGQPLLNQTILKNIEVQVPEPIEQKAIAHILGSLDDKIELNRQMNTTLEAMAQALFKSWFVDFDPVIDNALAAGNPIPDELEAKAAARQALGDARKPLPEDIRSLFPNAFVFTEEMGWIPEGWKIGCLADIAKHIQSNVKAEEIQDSDLYVGLEHIGRQRLFLENADYGDKVVSNKSRFNKLDILFGKLRPYFHKVCLAPESGICSTDILVFRPKKKYLQSLLTMVLYSEPLVEYANLRSTGTRMPRASSKDMLAYPFVKTPEKIAEYFDVILSPYWEKGIAINTEKQSLEQLRDTLLPKLLSGELRIPEAEELVEEAIA